MTTTETVKLAACPLCGAPAEILFITGMVFDWTARCSDKSCRCTIRRRAETSDVSDPARAEAIAAWNRRAGGEVEPVAWRSAMEAAVASLPGERSLEERPLDDLAGPNNVTWSAGWNAFREKAIRQILATTNPAPSVPVAPSPVAFVTPETMKDILAQSLWTAGAVGEFRCDNRHGFTVPLYAEPLPSPTAAPPSPQVEITEAMVEAAWRMLDGLAVVTHDDVRAALTGALSPTGGTTDPAFLPDPSAVQRSRPSGNTPDLVARLRDGIVVQQAGPSALIGTPDFAATVALMREAADRLESLSTIERQRDEAAAAVDAFAEICDELGCERDNEAGLQAAHALKAEVARLTEALKQHERILLIAAVRRAAEIAAPLWLKAADNAIAALQGGRG